MAGKEKVDEMGVEGNTADLALWTPNLLQGVARCDSSGLGPSAAGYLDRGVVVEWVEEKEDGRSASKVPLHPSTPPPPLPRHVSSQSTVVHPSQPSRRRLSPYRSDCSGLQAVWRLGHWPCWALLTLLTRLLTRERYLDGWLAQSVGLHLQVSHLRNRQSVRVLEPIWMLS